MGKKVERYSDIIDLPHHQSARRPHMPIYNRAAQFAPFAALTGYDTMVRNTADILLLNKQIMLDEDWKTVLDQKLKTILENPTQQLKVKITYFDSAATKLGGAYKEYKGAILTRKENPQRIAFVDGTEILAKSIIDIQAF